ncbi:unnamed protein product [Vicia faba]|uniref:Uncharacterized protein n=1 Tax=Vicia faba TaxID=3906 RepID=A0AAV1B6G1_VICFA|nr:unnamed protein product [Vicia faba]
MKGVKRNKHLVNNINGWLVSCEKFKDETVTDRNHGRDLGQVLMVSNTSNLKVGVYQHIVCFNFNIIKNINKSGLGLYCEVRYHLISENILEKRNCSALATTH